MCVADAAQWTVRDVCMWLEVNGLGQYTQAVLNADITGARLEREHTDKLLDVMGVQNPDHRTAVANATLSLFPRAIAVVSDNTVALAPPSIVV